MNLDTVKTMLDQKVMLYNKSDFIKDDPISIPHSYHRKQDIEITAFWVSMLSWGLRKTIIQKSQELFELMGESPYEFIVSHNEKDRLRFTDFKHRTFQYTDTLYFLDFLQRWYRSHNSLEAAFTSHMQAKDVDVSEALAGFHETFFDSEYAPKRTRKHVATPVRGSTCKRLNMYLRWMVRSSETGVDFGLWKGISPSQLLIPLDIHVDRIARRLGLITRKQRDFKTVIQLTEALRKFSPEDPVQYDFALFGMGVVEK